MYYFIPGTYVPLTMEGNIVVDRVLASCYASCHYDLVQIVAGPIQWFPEVIKWIFGDDNGSLAFINVALHFANWLVPDGTLNM